MAVEGYTQVTTWICDVCRTSHHVPRAERIRMTAEEGYSYLATTSWREVEGLRTHLMLTCSDRCRAHLAAECRALAASMSARYPAT